MKHSDVSTILQREYSEVAKDPCKHLRWRVLQPINYCCKTLIKILYLLRGLCYASATLDQKHAIIKSCMIDQGRYLSQTFAE